jgi:hypothetical protein
MSAKDYSMKTPYDIYIEYKSECIKLYEERKNIVFSLRSFENDYDEIFDCSVNYLLYQFRKNLEQIQDLKSEWLLYITGKNHKYNNDFKAELKNISLKIAMHPSNIERFMKENNIEFTDIPFNDLFSYFDDDEELEYTMNNTNILEEEDFYLDYYEDMNEDEFRKFMELVYY